MAMTASGGNLIPLAPSTPTATRVAKQGVVAARRRLISKEAGRAIEMLGHAIEYLADEFALDCVSETARARQGTHPRIAAIELLMERNREIYFSCPEAPSCASRFRSFLGLNRS
jgi:hypothetical protein